MQNPVDTAKVLGRRTIRFDSIDQLLADVERLAALDRAGNLKQCGNWTFGQALNHLATWCGYAFDGTPLSPPWFIKLILRFNKKGFIYKPMKSGVKIPGVENGTLATDAMPTDQAIQKYRDILQRLQRECPTKPNVIFGPLTHDEWINLQLRHAELHLSFFDQK